MSIFVRHTVKATIFFFAIAGFLLLAGYVAIRLGLTNTKGTIDTQSENFLTVLPKGTYTPFPLAHTEEWVAFRIAVTKDKSKIDAVSKETGVPSRLLIALLVPEQMRLFYSDRPLFKEVFSPLKVLGSQSQFSWGIFGIKDETARAVEAHLSDTHSPFYLGPTFQHMLDFQTTNSDEERFDRIIDEHDHTYAYLYAALYIAQIEHQWETAGYPIDTHPDIIATLWNLGFEKSIPNPTPHSGGSTLEINGKTYSFGRLAQDFYNSDEMIELFPK